MDDPASFYCLRCRKPISKELSDRQKVCDDCLVANAASQTALIGRRKKRRKTLGVVASALAIIAGATWLIVIAARVPDDGTNTADINSDLSASPEGSKGPYDRYMGPLGQGDRYIKKSASVSGYQYSVPQRPYDGSPQDQRVTVSVLLQNTLGIDLKGAKLDVRVYDSEGVEYWIPSVNVGRIPRHGSINVSASVDVPSGKKGLSARCAIFDDMWSADHPSE